MKKSTDRTRIGRLLAGAAPLALSLAALSSPAHAIVPNDNLDPNGDDVVDVDDEFSGVGMFFRNDGFVCTGTLINPRTVLFAAHCVNSVAAEDFNPNGGLRSAFSFNVNALPGFINWINNNFQSNPDLAVFDVNRIYYDPRSLDDPAAFGFLEADIAIASLSDPAANLPTWSLLFSPLPTPDQITDEDGTGYHVNITGYGRSGTGTTGASQGIDWRRRSAENMLGALTSFDERNTFLFGDPFGDLPQSLYRLDFDDPNKTNPFDFNLYKDEAREREGTTAGGDSGGPLVLDAANNTLSDEDLVIGVLSGGSRFFGPQVFSSYGTESFYQPLYLYWDYIVATNPYRYVSAKAGDGNWEDASHWETTLDPVYRVIDENGNVVNGLPTSIGLGPEGGSPDFGEVCFDPEGSNPGDGCQDLATGDDTPPAREDDPTSNVQSGIGVANVPSNSASILTSADSAEIVENIAINAAAPGTRAGMILGSEHQAQNGAPDFAEESPQGINGGGPEFSDDPLPAPTLDNGLPGATDFVPDNIDPVIDVDPNVNVDPRYFDVTLANGGTTTLNSTVTIDRLTVRSTAGLDVTAGSSLTSLIDISQFGGTVNVDGDIASVGDYTLFGGVLGGNGTITAPFLTNIMGAIAPGGMDNVGTLNVDGSLVLSSGSTLLVELGPNGASDLIAVSQVDTGEVDGDGNPILAGGEASVGGVVALGGLEDLPRVNDVTYTIVTAEGGVTGTFSDQQLSAILAQTFTYNPTSVEMTIEIGNYVDVVTPFNQNQLAYAQLLDAERGNAALADFFELDFATAAEIQDVLNSLAPTTETAVQSQVTQNLTNLFNFNDKRLNSASLASTGGTIATYGDPIGQTALVTRYSAGAGAAPSMGLQGEPTNVESGAVPYNMGIFLAGGYIDGAGDSQPFVLGTRDVRDRFDGYYFGGGVEFYPNEGSLIGVSAYYSDVEGDVTLNNSVDTKMIAGSVYGRTMLGENVVLDAQASLVDFDVDTVRNVSLLGAAQTLTSSRSSTGFNAGVGLGYQIPLGNGGALTPNVDLRYTSVEFDSVTETGGSAALRFGETEFESFQTRAGVDFQTSSSSPLQLKASAHYVHDFDDDPNVIIGGFAAGTATAGFPVVSTDQDWAELGASLNYNSGPVTFGVGVDMTVSRTNADTEVYSATATIKF